MRALLSRTPGGPDTLVLSDLPDPVPGPDAVLVRIEACGVNFPDVLIIEDKYQFRPERPFAPGAEIAGVVEAVGADVTGLSPGDRVAALPGWGGMAEKMAIPAQDCVRIPDTTPFDEAAAFIMTYGTSHHALRQRAELKPGQTVLILGAAGGVGLAAVELAKAMGARVIAAASDEEKLALARAHGADETVLYPHGPFDTAGRKALAALFKDACGPGGADVILDPVGGDYSEAALRAIAWNGRFLVVGFPAGLPALPLNLPLLKGCSVVGVFYGAFCERERPANRANLDELLDLYRAGRIKPSIHARYPLAQGSHAIAALSARQALGKIVVMVQE
jgi:NADPH2:quinone reductase